MGVPTGNILHLLALQHLVLVDDILEDLKYACSLRELASMGRRMGADVGAIGGSDGAQLEDQANTLNLQPKYVGVFCHQGDHRAPKCEPIQT